MMPEEIRELDRSGVARRLVTITAPRAGIVLHRTAECWGYNGSTPAPHRRSTRKRPVLVPVGTTRVIEFVATEPGDWAMHCHMTHHTMTQMGHDIPVMLGVNTKKLDQRMSRVTPAYMTMGTTGMGGMGEMEMPIPPNSIPMRGAPGPFSYIDMGGMFTFLKVRDQLSEEDLTAFYKYPKGRPQSAQRPRNCLPMASRSRPDGRASAERDPCADDPAIVSDVDIRQRPAPWYEMHWPR